jgi:hypothetical protein
MRKMLPFLLCVLGLPCALLAQASQSSWSNLQGLQPGLKIQLIEMNSTKHSGTFLAVSDSAIRYQTDSGEQATQKENVRTVKLMENRHRLRNTLIFGGIGAGAGAGIGAASTGHAGSIIFGVSRGKGAAVGAVVGVIAGATVGALLPSHSTIYSVSSH